MVQDISNTKWYWDLDPWRSKPHQLRLRVEDGRWTDITLQEGNLGRDTNGQRLDDEYPALYHEFTFQMLNSEYLANADGIEYATGRGVEPERAFAPPTTGEIARARGQLPESTIRLIRRWWKIGVSAVTLFVVYLMFKDAPWDEFIAWYMENLGGGMPPP